MAGRRRRGASRVLQVDRPTLLYQVPERTELALLEEVFDGWLMFVLVNPIIFPAKSVQTIISPELPDRL
jgi:hypothetical protein